MSPNITFIPEEKEEEEMSVSISMPTAMFDETAMTNLKRLVESKSELMKRAFKNSELSIEEEEERVTFPWFQVDANPEEIRAYTLFIQKLCEMAIRQKRINQTKKEIVNEKYEFPAWIYYDSYSARYFVEEMQMQGFTMVRCIQGAKTLSLPMQMLGADLQAHKVNYNNNPILKWCLTNTGIQTDRNGNIVPIKNQSPKQRIDGAAALLDCYVGLYEHYNEFTGAI